MKLHLKDTCHSKFEITIFTLLIQCHSICQNAKPFEAFRNYDDFHDECY